MEGLSTLVMSTKTMSSLEIAELTGKQHKDVLKAIRNMENAWVKTTGRKFALSEYKDSTGRTLPCYQLTKLECLYIGTKFNDEARAKLVLRWEQLETEKRELSRKELALMVIQAEEEKERLMLENKQQNETIQQQNIQIAAMSEEIVEMKQKTDYLEIILSSVGSVTTTQIAQDYGMSAVAFNKQLEAMRIQRKVNGQWILYAPYISEGFILSKTINITRSDGRPDTVMHTEWRQKGRLFLYNKLKEIGILPLIERMAIQQVQNSQETIDQQ
mgnify:CR=1 FL=1